MFIIGNHPLISYQKPLITI